MKKMILFVLVGVYLVGLCHSTVAQLQFQGVIPESVNKIDNSSQPRGMLQQQHTLFNTDQVNGGSDAKTVELVVTHEPESHDFVVYEAVNKKEYFHDPNSFTQGFLYHEGVFYESTGNPPGLNIESYIRTYKIQSNDSMMTLSQTESDNKFGEGIAILNDKLYQLINQKDTLRVYNLDLQLQEVRGTGLKTGWGATSDGEYLIVSDGTDILYYYDVTNFLQVKKLHVTFQGNSFILLNELEWINGMIWANTFQSNCIVGIDPESGRILKVLHVDRNLYRNKLIADNHLVNNREAVLNGIAHDKQTNRTFITGKLWPHIYEIEFQPSYDQNSIHGGVAPYWNVIYMCY